MKSNSTNSLTYILIYKVYNLEGFRYEYKLQLAKRRFVNLSKPNMMGYIFRNQEILGRVIYLIFYFFLGSRKKDYERYLCGWLNNLCETIGKYTVNLNRGTHFQTIEYKSFLLFYIGMILCIYIYFLFLQAIDHYWQWHPRILEDIYIYIF